MSNRLAISTAALLLATALAACASSANRTETGGGEDSSGGCGLRPQDSTFAAGGPVYRDCAVKTKARNVTTDIHPDFRPTTAGNGCYSVELEYVVDQKGFAETKTARIVRTNNQAFAESVISILPQWKFEPAKRDGVPVRQIMIDKQSMMTRVVRVVVPAGSPPTPADAKAAAGRPGPGC